MGSDDTHIGQTGGIRLNQENNTAYVICPGYGVCYLQKITVDPNSGKGIFVERIDVRSRDIINTDNWGEITIVKKKLKTAMSISLTAIATWLTQFANTNTISIEIAKD